MKKLPCSILLLLFLNPAFSQYNFYYGNIHAHSGYSDGNKDSVISGYTRPGDNYNYAKNSYHFDFLGISDHNHSQAGMDNLADYHAGLFQADTSNQDGSFVSLYGMEWGVISNGGHVIIYGIDSLIGWDKEGTSPGYDIYCDKYDYTGLWNILKQKPGCFATLAHPDTYDYDSLNQRGYNEDPDRVVTGVAIRSGSAFSETNDYTDAPPTLSASFYKKMLAKGYLVGPTIDHDNHNTNFGRTNMTRTVVLAQSLSRDSILDAYRQMRFYASDDWNAQLNFNVDGAYMGSNILCLNNSSIAVSISDADAGDDVSKIDIYYGVPGSGVNATLLATISGSSTFNYVHPTSIGESFYYYARVTQVDSDQLWSAPIWIKRSGLLPVNIITFSGKPFEEKIRLQWQVTAEEGMENYIVEKSLDGRQYQPIGNIRARNIDGTNYYFDDEDPQDGLQFYRLKQIELDGEIKYSQIITVKYKKAFFTIARLYPNPVKTTLSVEINSLVKTGATMRIYNAEGRMVQLTSQHLREGENNISTSVTDFPAGYYYLVLFREGSRVAETAFIKE